MKLSSDNILFMTDSYKLTHYVQLPPNTTNIYSYLESRGGKFGHSLFFGLQYIIKKYLAGKVITQEKINEAYSFSLKHFGHSSGTFNKKGWEYILEKYEGKLPVEIKAVAEGSIVPVKNVLVTVENTDPNCFWLTNYLETLLVQVWYPITVATQSWYMKKMLNKYLEETGDPSLLDFKLHDFGFRGVSSVETAGIGGMAHLVNFKGTDTIAGIVLANEFYDSDICGFSIPASEHSTITAWGEDHEVDAMRNMLEQYPDGLVACVSDSFDIYRACKDYWGDKLFNNVINRNGVLVIRPDSGEPNEVLPKIFNILGDKFGYSTNEKGFKVLNPKVRVIQGDGVEFDTLNSFLSVLKINGWSIDNIAFGSGGGLLQKLNRDTMKFAFKCSNAIIDGENRNVWKSPITDSVKISKKGRLKLIRVPGQNAGLFNTVSDKYYGNDQLRTVFKNGDLLIDENFDTIRQRAGEMTKWLSFLD
jgi:nicotinamide phosphoribosyltransferase